MAYRKRPEKWIGNVPIKHGALRRQLHIKQNEVIPTATLLAITGAKLGSKVHGATVTPKLKKRAQFALNIRDD